MSRLGASSTAGGGAFSPAAMSLLANSSLRVTGSGSGSGGMGGGQNNSGQQQQYQYQGRSSSPPAETRKREPSLGEKLNELREQEQQYDSGTYGSQGQASPTAAAAAAAGPRSPFASPPPSNMRSPEQQRGAGRGAYQSEGEASSSFLSPGMQHYGGGETSDYHHHQQQQQDGGHASSIPPLPPAHRRTRSRSLDESAISSSASPPSGADELRDAIAGVDESAAASHTKSNGASRRRSSGSNNGPSIQTSPTNTGMPPVHPPTSPGFGGATAAGFFRSHLRAIAFTARVSHLSGLHNAGGAGDDASSPGSAGSFGVGGGSDGHGLGMSGGGGAYDEREMSEAQFLKLAESLSKDEATKTMSSMYQSLQQFRTLLVESRTLAGSELQTEQTFVTIVTRVRSVVAAEHVLLMMVDKSAELLYCSAATTPQGAVAYHTSLTHSFAGHVLRYKAALNLRFAAEKDPRFDPDLAHKLGPGTKFRSVLAVPVFNKQGAITAVLLCINKRGGAGQSSSIASDVHSHLSSSSSRSSGGVVREHGRVSSASSEKSFFSEQDQSLVEFIAVLAGSTIENALLFDEAVTRRQQTETLLSVTELMSAEVDTHKLIARMLEASYLLVSAEKITLYMIDADKEELVAMTRGGYYQQQQQQQQQQAQHQQQQEQGLSGGASASSGPNNNDVNSPNAANASSPQRFSINRGILGFCATSGKLVNTSDARRDWRFDPEVDAPGGDGDVKSMLVVPVTDHLSKPIAIIQAVNKISYAHPFNAAPITGGSGNGSNSIGPHGGHQQRQHQPQHPGFRDRRVSFSGNSLHSGKTGGSNWGASGGVGVGGGGSGGGGHLTTQLSHQLPYFTRDEEALLQSMAVSAGIILRKARALEEALLAKKRADALLQISELMSADLQSDKIMAKIVQAAYMLVRCEYILLYMVDEAKGELVCEVGKDGSKGSRIPLGHGVAGHTALTGRTLNIHNAQNDWRFEPSEHAHLMGGGSGKGTGSQSGGVRTILAIPIKDYLGKNVGVLEIINKRSPSSQIVAFTAEDEDVLNSLAYTAGAVLRKAALFDQSVQAQKRSNALLQISEIMSAEIGSEAIMKRIIEASYALVDAERITLFTVDPKTGELVCQVSKDPFFQGVRMGYGHGIVGHVALTRRSLNITDAYSDPRFNQLSDMKTGYKTRSILTVPVTDRKGQAVAVVQAVNKRSSSHFTSEDVLLLESMAVNAGMLLSRSRLYDAAVVADRKSRALVRLVMTATREDQSTEWIMHEIGRVAYDALCADRVLIFFCDQVAELLTCVVAPENEEEGWTMALGRGIAGYVALTGEMVNAEDATKHPKFDAKVDVRNGGYRPKSILAMGIKNADGEVIAVIYAVNKRTAAKQAKMQWSAVNANHSSGLTPHAGSSGHDGRHAQASPLRPHGAPPGASASSSPANNVNAYSSNLPPQSQGVGQGQSQTTPLRRHNSRSSQLGSMSPWHSLRQGSMMMDDDAHGAGPQSSSQQQGLGRMSPMNSLPSPVRGRGSISLPDGMQELPAAWNGGHGYEQMGRSSGGGGGGGGHHHHHHHHSGLPRSNSSHSLSSNSSNQPDPESIEPFNKDDEEVLAAICQEVRSLLVRHVRETMLEMNQLSMNDGVFSLMDMYSGTQSTTSRMAVAAAAERAGPGAANGKAPNLMRTGTLTRNSKRPLRSGAGGGKGTAADVNATGNVPWPISTRKFSDLLSLEFNVWTYNPDELLCFAFEMFVDMRLVDEFQIPHETLKAFFLTVRQNYHDNPFHNWYHGFSVLHFSYLALRVLTNCSEYLTQHDVLALMIASLCHDVDHPGNTNSFEINTGSELALIHNDLSVLESHHAYTTFRILRAKQSNVLCNVRKDTFMSLKKMIVGAIMSTDMISHFSECRNLEGLNCESSVPFNIKVPADRQIVVNLLIHSADLSAQCFPTTVASVWEERITREFESQAAKEKKLGIPVAEFMQNLTNPLLRRQNQVNFIDVVLMPWWRATTRLFPGFKPCYKNLIVNRGYYASSEQSPAPSPQSLSSTVNTPAVLPTPAPATTLPAMPTLHQQQQQQSTAAPSSAVSPRRVAQEGELKTHDDDPHAADEHDAQEHEHEPDDEDAQSPHSPYDDEHDDDDGGNDDHDSGVGSGQEDALDGHSGDEDHHADHRE